jgi:hypothetical protein
MKTPNQAVDTDAASLAAQARPKPLDAKEAS